MPDRYDVLIKDSMIVDGTGKPAFKGSVGIRGEKIAAVGDFKGDAAKVIEGSGLVTCPGFVDSHSHADRSILQYPLAENLVMQGITTFLGGNCGSCLAPIKDPTHVKAVIEELGLDIEPAWRTFGEWLSKVEEAGMSLNYAPLLGHNTIRVAVMGEDFKRKAAFSEIEEMKDLVDEGMRSGAFGLSSVFDSSPGEYAAIEEIIELVKVAREYGGLYSPHTRHHENQWWSDNLEEYGYGLYHGPKGEIIAGRYHGLLEAVEIAKIASIPLLIAHFTPAYIIPQPQPELLEEAAAKATLMEVIDKARGEGVEVHYNVIAWSQSMASQALITDSFFNPRLVLPAWLKEMGREEFVEKLKMRAFREKVKGVVYSDRLKFGMIHPITDPYWMDCFKILRCRNKEYEGKTIGELARKRSPDRIVDAVYNESLEALFDILTEDPHATWAMILEKRTYPGALPVFLKHPAGMPGTDTSALPGTLEALAKDRGTASADTCACGIAPTQYGLFPHYIRTFVKEKGALSLEEAIKKATYLPAQEVLGLKDRGIINVGAYADIVLFDFEKIREKGDFLEPAQPPVGIEYVLVNGTLVCEKKAHTGKRPGKVLRRK